MESKFKTYFSEMTPDQRESLATNADTSVAYLRQVASGHRNAGANLIDRLLKADPLITYEMIRSNAA